MSNQYEQTLKTAIKDLNDIGTIERHINPTDRLIATGFPIALYAVITFLIPTIPEIIGYIGLGIVTIASIVLYIRPPLSKMNTELFINISYDELPMGVDIVGFQEQNPDGFINVSGSKIIIDVISENLKWRLYTENNHGVLNLQNATRHDSNAKMPFPEPEENYRQIELDNLWLKIPENISDEDITPEKTTSIPFIDNIFERIS